jgi:hypothetical protein
MKRRKLLAVPGITMAANLVACGGGSDDANEATPGASLSAADFDQKMNAVQATGLVPRNSIYWVEITTHRPAGVTVRVTPQDVNVPNDFFEVKPASRVGSVGPAYLAWIDLRVGDLNKLSIKATLASPATGLWVSGTNNQSTPPGQTAGPIRSGRPLNGLVSQSYSDVEEYVYKFVDSSNVPYAVVRFYPYDSRFGPAPSFSGSRISGLSNNFSYTDFDSPSGRGLKATSRALQLDSTANPSYRLLTYDVGDTSGTGLNDAISYPDRGNAALSCVHKPLLAVSDQNHRTLLKHRVWKYFVHLVSSYNGTSLGTASVQAAGHVIGNDVYRALGGDDYIGEMNKLVNHVTAKLSDAFTNAAQNFESWLSSSVASMVDVPSGSNIGQAAIPNMDSKLDKLVDLVMGIGGGGSVSMSAQIGGKITYPGWVFPLKGFRISFGLFRDTRVGILGGGKVQTTYGVYNNGGKLKLGMTGIFPVGDINLRGIKFSSDVELNFSVTIFNGVFRLDMVQLDPVLDLDTRSWLWTHIVSPACEKLAQLTPNGSSAVSAVSNVASYLNSAFATSTAVAWSAFHPGNTAVVARTMREGGELSAQVVGSIVNATKQFAWTLPWRSWATVEFSPVRLTIPNTDLGNPNQSFRGGFKFPTDIKDLVGYTPGAKFITGPGIEFEATGIGKIFIRTVAVFDGFLIFGSDNWRKAMSFWDYSGGD